MTEHPAKRACHSFGFVINRVLFFVGRISIWIVYLHGITTTVRSFTVFQVIGMQMAEKIAISLPYGYPRRSQTYPKG
jgi:hypothetical protein